MFSLCLRGFSPAIPQSKDMQVRLIGVSVSGCPSQYVSPLCSLDFANCCYFQELTGYIVGLDKHTWKNHAANKSASFIFRWNFLFQILYPVKTLSEIPECEAKREDSNL